MKDFKGTLVRATGILVAMTLICGVFYTVIVTVIAQIVFPEKANGSIIEVNGVKYGSELLGQEFTDENHMWGRIMKLNTTTFQGEDGNYYMYSGAFNLSPKSDAFQEIVDERIAMIQVAHPNSDIDKIPVDLVTNSGSGLDPHISVAAAEYQIERLATANGISEEEVQEIIDRCTDKKIFGIFGEDIVNVLKVNLILEGILE